MKIYLKIKFTFRMNPTNFTDDIKKQSLFRECQFNIFCYSA